MQNTSTNITEDGKTMNSEDDTFNTLKRTPFHEVFGFLYQHTDWTREQDEAYLKPHGWTRPELDAEIQRVYYPPIAEDNW